MTLFLSRVLEALRSHAGLQWACLLVSSAFFVALLEELHLSAALLLGPMITGIVLACAGGRIRVNGTVFAATQALIGCMIARAIPVSILHEAARLWPVFVLGVGSTIAMAALNGWTLTRWRVLPGTTAIWGSWPGGAAAMTVMAEAYGADIRLVAFMQYPRVLCVTTVASFVASAAGLGHWPALHARNPRSCRRSTAACPYRHPGADCRVRRSWNDPRQGCGRGPAHSLSRDQPRWDRYRGHHRGLQSGGCALRIIDAVRARHHCAGDCAAAGAFPCGKTNGANLIRVELVPSASAHELAFPAARGNIRFSR